MLEEEKNPWKTLASREIYQNPWIRVREDEVITPSGSIGIYGVVEAKIATGVIAVEDNAIYLVGQYRYPINLYSWEIIEGGTDTNESPLEAAQRELREEAGLNANSWEPLGQPVFLSNCFSTEQGQVFVARDLSVTTKQPEDTEQLVVRKVPFNQVQELLATGYITDALSIIGLYRFFSEGP